MKNPFRFMSSARPLLAVCLVAALPLAVRALDPAQPGAAEQAGSGAGDSREAAAALYYGGNYEESLAMQRRCAERNPDDVGVQMDLVRLLSETGLYDEAYGRLLRLSAAHPGEAAFRRELLKVAFLSGRAVRDSGLPSADPGDPESAVWSALVRMAEGDGEGALECIDSAVALSAYFPLAHFFRAELLLAKGSYPEAEAAYNTALGQEPNLTIAFLPLARAKLGQGKYESAFGLLGRASLSLPWDGKIRDELSALTASRPELAAGKEEKKLAARKIAVPPVLVPILDHESIPPIRIGLAEKLREAHLKTGAEYTLTALSGTGEQAAVSPAPPALTGPKGELLGVVSGADGVSILREDGTEAARDPRGFTLSYADRGATTILFDLAWGSGYFFAGTEDRYYRGSVRFENRKDGLTVVNTLNVEEYLYSIVPSEMPSSWPKAALEAQAVAARTYTLEGVGRYEGRGFDLLASVSSAAYPGASRERKSTNAAVDATRGIVVTAKGKLVDTVYSSNSGGYTESSESAWGYPSVLAAVPDKLTAPRDAPLPPEELARRLEERPSLYCSQPSFSSRSAFRWRQVVSSEELLSRLGSKPGRIRSIITRGRGISGRVEQVEVVGTEGSVVVKRDNIRSMLGGLRSNLFMVEPRIGPDGFPDYFLFTGGGWGHGVGMDQSGAAGMANAGYTVLEILTHYYPGTDLTVRY